MGILNIRTAVLIVQRLMLTLYARWIRFSHVHVAHCGIAPMAAVRNHNLRAAWLSGIAMLATGLLILSSDLLGHSDQEAMADGATPSVQHGRRLKEGAALEPGISVRIEAGELYKGQEGQDKWVNEHIFHGRRNGVFVDLGCYDGVTYSNTWYFERVLNWSGVCVEPNPEVFARISIDARRESGVQAAISNANGRMPFVAAYMRSSLNATAVDYQATPHHGRAHDEPDWLPLTRSFASVRSFWRLRACMPSR